MEIKFVLLKSVSSKIMRNSVLYAKYFLLCSAHHNLFNTDKHETNHTPTHQNLMPN